MLSLQKRPLEKKGEDDKENEAPEKRSKVPEREEKIKKSFKDDKKISLKQARKFLIEHPEVFAERNEKKIQGKLTKMQKKFSTL